jgi:ankyrin repeat protein
LTKSSDSLEEVPMSVEWLHILDESGQTPLDRAFNSGHMALAELMLRQERDDHRESLQRSTPLHRAAYLGLTDAVRSLMHFGANPNTRDAHGETALHKACRAGNVSVVEVLRERCDLNAVNGAGLTPLHWACLAGRADVAEYLLTHGADPCLRAAHLDGLSPLDLARLMGHDEIVLSLSARAAFA